MRIQLRPQLGLQLFFGLKFTCKPLGTGRDFFIEFPLSTVSNSTIL